MAVDIHFYSCIEKLASLGSRSVNGLYRSSPVRDNPLVARFPNRKDARGLMPLLAFFLDAMLSFPSGNHVVHVINELARLAVILPHNVYADLENLLVVEGGDHGDVPPELPAAFVFCAVYLSQGHTPVYIPQPASD